MKAIFVWAAIALAATACVGVPPDPFKLPPSSLADRQMQSRTFETTDDALLLSSSVAVLQDLGYALDATNSHLGVLTASKEISARSATQLITAMLWAGPLADTQKIRVCLVVSRVASRPDASVARITIQRIVSDTSGMTLEATAVTEPALYQAFFAKLETATFLEANPT